MVSGIQQSVPLAPYTTLGVGGNAQYFVEVHSKEALQNVCRFAREENLPITIIGGGSNILVGDEGLSGLVVRVLMQNVTYEESESTVRLHVGAGVEFDAYIHGTTERGLWGLENLSGIPGLVGAVPIQNVGAYGVEVGECIECVHVYDPIKDAFFDIPNVECKFAYRYSCFKEIENAHLIVCGVTFKLTKANKPVLTYKDIATSLETMPHSTPQDIREIVLQIRSKKFPDWHVLGTAGSFFKNPIIPNKVFADLKKQYPQLPGFPYDETTTKMSLGYVLDQVCGLRGYYKNDVGLFENQALVLVCKKNISAEEIKTFVAFVKREVFNKTKISIEEEVKIF